MEYSLELGNNLTSLGIVFLFFKFLLPILIALVLLGIAFYAIRQILAVAQIENQNITYILLFGLFVLLTVIYAL
jgi:hypothetical protein